MNMRTIIPARVDLKWATLTEARASVETLRFAMQAAATHADLYVRQEIELRQEANHERDATDFFVSAEFAAASPAGPRPRYIYTPKGKEVVLMDGAVEPTKSSAPGNVVLVAPPDNVRHIMLDLETLGKRPGCCVLSIGAVEFGPQGLGAEFKINLSVPEQQALGLHVDASAEEWWSRQSEQARAAARFDPKDPATALKIFNAWVRDLGQRRGIRVWGNGANFDQPVLGAVYAAFEDSPPWEFWNERCHRTMKNLFKAIEAPTAPAVAHDALEDAKAQAAHLVKILNSANLWATV